MTDDTRPAARGPVLAGADALRRFFAGLVENTFQADLGVADPHLTDYLGDLLVRFTPAAASAGPPDFAAFGGLWDRPGGPRHAGDVALFWAGLYPRRLARAAARGESVGPAGVSALGRAAYRRAAGAGDGDDGCGGDRGDGRPVLLRLADQFDLCAAGLGRVRRCWEGDTPAA